MSTLESRTWKMATKAVRGEEHCLSPFEANRDVAIANLESFLGGEDGKLALDLIAATGKPLIFAFDPDENRSSYGVRYGLVKELDGQGRFVRITTYDVPAKETFGPHTQELYETITPTDAVIAAERFGGVHPSNFEGHLRILLNTIAANALRP